MSDKCIDILNGGRVRTPRTNAREVAFNFRRRISRDRSMPPANTNGTLAIGGNFNVLARDHLITQLDQGGVDTLDVSIQLGALGDV